MRQTPAILIVTSGPGEPQALVTTVQRMQATVLTAATCDRACHLLSSAAIDVVITDVSLADGNWRDLMAYLLNEGLNPCVVVRSAADDPCLWSEVLWRGAYEMLVEPFSVEEAVRILEGALRTREYFQLENTRVAPVAMGRMRADGEPDDIPVRVESYS